LPQSRRASRAGPVNLFSAGLVTRDSSGWSITDAGRRYLADVEAGGAGLPEQVVVSEPELAGTCMIEGQLIARRVNDDPPGYRISFDGVEVGSIAKRTHHVQLNDSWHCCDATHGSRRPSARRRCLVVEAALTRYRHRDIARKNMGIFHSR
jgi:hypothetical protein